MGKGIDMTRICGYATALWIVLFGQAFFGFAQQKVAPAPIAAPELTIGPGDLLDLSMFEDPELSGHFRVDAKGEIVVPLIGHVHVGGLTADQAGAKIEKRYVIAGILTPDNSHATVFIAEYATQGIVVNGEVKNPGVYPALGIRMLNDVIAAAGGITQTAASNVIITHRNDPENPVTVSYNPEALHPKIPEVQVLPGDSIVVPRAGIVYVLGDVVHAGGFVLNGRNTLTVEEAMALAGGSSHAAALGRVQLVRTLNNGRKEAVTIHFNKILKGDAPDVAMKDGDVLYVPTSNAILVTQQAIAAAVSIGSEVLIFRYAYYP